MKRSHVATMLLLAALLHAVLALLGAREKSATFDETAHLTGGYVFNGSHDYRMHPENGILPQRLQALPAILSKAHSPSMETAAWRESDVWLHGRAYLHQSGNDAAWLLMSGRAMNTLFSAGTVLLVGVWAWYLFGRVGLLTAIPFAALCPNLLAHGALATSDLAMTFFLLASLSAYGWHLSSRKVGVFALSVLTFGLACVAKYTAVLLLPMFGLIALFRLWEIRRQAAEFAGSHSAPHLSRKLVLLGRSSVAHAAGAAFVIWAFFGFRFSAMNPELPAGILTYPWSFLLDDSGIIGKAADLCRSLHLLPEAFIYGFLFVLKRAGARGAFLDGEVSIHGWTEFFPKALAYKTTPALLLASVAGALVIALVIAGKQPEPLRERLKKAVPLLVLFVVYWAFSLTSQLNIGHRHILPTYPVLYLLTGALGWVATRLVERPLKRIAALLALVVAPAATHAWSSLSTYPHFLAYFSPVAGGPEQGYRHLVDSSLDWGQDLPGLARWLTLNRQAHEALHLSYFGSDDPQFYGIQAELLPTIIDYRSTRPWTWLKPGLYAISATMLQHAYMPVRGAWSAEREAEYQQFRSLEPAFRLLKSAPYGHPELFVAADPQIWQLRWTRYELLRFARLCGYLRLRRPDAMIGYSILIFRLSQEDLDATLNGPVSTLVTAMENAANAAR